jgi:hypothetical protein
MSFDIFHVRESGLYFSLLSITFTSTLFMWPFLGPRNPYRETIKAKRERRVEAIKLAPLFNAEEHLKYLNATGIVLWFMHLSACSLLASPRSADFFFFFLVGTT